MESFIVTSFTGWVLIALLIITILYPFFLRKGLLGPIQPFLQRMRFHYWFGYSLAGILVIHAFLPMMASFIRGVNTLGLYLATGAFFLIYIQVAIGYNLKYPKLTLRRMVRHWHFWIMVAIVVFVAGHVILNSLTIQMIAHR